MTILLDVQQDLEDIAFFLELDPPYTHVIVATNIGCISITENNTHMVLDAYGLKETMYCSKSLEDPAYISFKEWLYANPDTDVSILEKLCIDGFDGSAYFRQSDMHIDEEGYPGTYFKKANHLPSHLQMPYYLHLVMSKYPNLNARQTWYVAEYLSTCCTALEQDVQMYFWIEE